MMKIPFPKRETVDGEILPDGTVKLTPKITFTVPSYGFKVKINHSLLDAETEAKIVKASKKIAEDMNCDIFNAIMGVGKK